jgi:DEP domain-containing protein 5
VLNVSELLQLDQPVDRASHVEIIFRDEYLTRADMWRLAVAVLSNKMICKGQRIWFMGTIKALVQTIFVQGQKVQSAYFDASTKPIFRSESARYVLFIQMSKEMWDFDADSTGEIMFSKVINGFLPELFGRWGRRNVKHLISIVLFTRLEYERLHIKDLGCSETEVGCSGRSVATEDTSYRDFYRVVVSDMAGGQWADILKQLKSEFKVFLRDVSICRPEKFQYPPLGTGRSAISSSAPEYVIAGHPSTAMRGNILEAINLASSQFSCDHIDRDLVRTGVSIAIITPGTGVFEVDYRLLIKTTEKLIENGVGIDLVCLSRVPLHSVPLFKYWQPSSQSREARNSCLDTNRDDGLLSKSIPNTSSSPTVPRASFPSEDMKSRDVNPLNLTTGSWLYGIPHWIDVSFWTSSQENLDQVACTGKTVERLNLVRHRRKAFVPRVRMYQLQMMGVLEDVMSEISIPHLPEYSTAANFYFTKALNSRIQDADHYLSVFGRTPLNQRTSPHIEKAAEMEAPRLNPGSSFPVKTPNDPHGYGWVDEYDSMVFCHPRNRMANENISKRSKATQDKTKPCWHPDQGHFPVEILADSASSRDGGKYGFDSKNSFSSTIMGGGLAQYVVKKRGSILSTVSSNKAPPFQKDRHLRQLSFGPRGFAGALKASASTEISAEHAKSGLPSGRGLRIRSSIKNKNDGQWGPSVVAYAQKPGDSSGAALSHGRREALDMLDEHAQKISRPISIKKFAAACARSDYGRFTRGELESNHAQDFGIGSDISVMQNLTPSSGLATSTDVHDVKIALSPGSSVAPWLTILNPSNPRKMNITLASRLGRWQHTFPRPLRASKIKWKSLCSPAAVPLTTEDFPASAEIVAEYDESNYTVVCLQEDDSPETPRSPDWLLREMVAFRFTQGFQVVVGPRIEQSMNLATHQIIDIFEDNIFSAGGSTIFMSRGNLIHQLSYLEGGGAAIKCLARRTMSTSRSEYFEDSPKLYTPAIRTMHAQEYTTQIIDVSSEQSEPLWETMDSFIANHQLSLQEPISEKVRSWRARFVLIPVDPPLSGRRALDPVNEDNEEEIRLEGIRKLTQIWQRFRYVSPSNRCFQASDRKRKDTNPLDIIYRTQNPSTIIEAELESIIGSETSGKPLQLLPDSDLYQRSNLDLMSLAQAIQGEKGVRMMDRRWHWRLHYKCFVGFEFTTWLLETFRDVETRDEAVKLGNELMRSGLFKHVERRHQFRDGNFFYQIASEYHTPSRSWLGRSDVSVPSTPLSEGISHGSSNLPGSQGNSSGAAQKDLGASTPVARKQRLGVALSKSLLYDVDIRKRSHRPEVVTVHYDRLHNPDNCYHILLEWMNCTAKLIEDAVVSWATTVERFGLRLVELPLGEAGAITKMHPFRAPTLVGLAVRPPGEQPPSLCNTTSLSTSVKFENHPYQKAIMKKFQFVLDLEAATDFPSDVNVTYSWGRPHYRYPQYIHRSGAILAQITDEGKFLLLANRLYNNRSTASLENERSHHTDFPGTSARYSPVRGSNHGRSPRISPLSSPSAHAAQDGPTLSGNHPRLSPPSASRTPEQILAEFEAFCHDASALNQFYQRVLSKALSPGGNTPFLEGNIPSLGVLPNLALGEASLCPSPTGEAPVPK